MGIFLDAAVPFDTDWRIHIIAASFNSDRATSAHLINDIINDPSNVPFSLGLRSTNISQRET